ncbi:MAG: cytidine deaminase [Oscillospiraceae bacterium]|nr:cytidine deaminase [Oscillospiraceae bacterium]
MTDRELITQAMHASIHAYAPYSKFRVGAALECQDGTVFTGCNVENAALGASICAERCAVLKAISEGKRKFLRIAVYSQSADYCVPCGTCRQVLCEFAPEIELLCARSDGRYVSYRLRDLLPHSFTKDFL